MRTVSPCIYHATTKLVDIVLVSLGPVFSSGHDLKEVRQMQVDAQHGNGEEILALFEQCSTLMCSITELRCPVIAKVKGIATAAGCQLVASCDMAFATTESRFATPGVNIGLFCSTPSVALSRSVGKKAAMEMLLTGHRRVSVIIPWSSH